MKTVLTAAAAAFVLSAGPVAAQPDQPVLAQSAAPADPVAAEFQAAEANKPRIKTRPSWKSGPDADLTEAERAQGVHGKVEVQAVLGEDGRLRHGRVRTTSGSPELDARAVTLASEQLFEPARDAEGKAVAIPITFPMEFVNYRSAGEGGGILRYGCDQFARDMDWWRATHPQAKWSDHELYTMFVGLRTLMMMGQGQLLTGDSLKAMLADFERRWVKAVDACRKKPTKRFVDVFKPEGDWAARLAAPQR